MQEKTDVIPISYNQGDVHFEIAAKDVTMAYFKELFTIQHQGEPIRERELFRLIKDFRGEYSGFFDRAIKRNPKLREMKDWQVTEVLDTMKEQVSVPGDKVLELVRDPPAWTFQRSPPGIRGNLRVSSSRFGAVLALLYFLNARTCALEQTNRCDYSGTLGGLVRRPRI